jgi:GDPmannose 4,6-dehydratase
MRALVTGITGQDGSYLAELLLDKGYEVHGLIRRTSSFNTMRIDHILDRLELHYGDLVDGSGLIRIVDRVKPDEIYNLGCMSHVRVSFDIPVYCHETIIIGTMNLLEAIRQCLDVTKVKFYQASSSVVGDTPIIVKHIATGTVEVIDISEIENTYNNYMALCNIGGRAKFSKITGFSKHRKDHIYNLRYSGGGNVGVTGDHSVEVLDNDGYIISQRVDQLSIGDNIVSLDSSFGDSIRSKFSSELLGFENKQIRSLDIECLPVAPFQNFVNTNKKRYSKKRLKELLAGEELSEPCRQLLDGDFSTVIVKDLIREDGDFLVYDIEVADAGTFIGGNIPILLHNSEMFGSEPPSQNELTRFSPRSPYACSKVCAYHQVINYREAYGLFACNGILFNHESNPYYSPILLRRGGLVDVREIGELITLEKDDLCREVDFRDKALEIWDNGKWSKILTVSGYRTKKEVVRLNSRHGYVELTAGHKLHMKSGPRDVCDVSVGDEVEERVLPTEFGDKEIGYDWAWLLGFFAGDGTQHGGSLAFFNKNKSLLIRIEDILKDRYLGCNVNWKPHRSGFGNNVNSKIKVTGCPGLVPWIRQNCYSTSRLKKVPIDILNSKKEDMVAYLAGYCAADGTKSMKQLRYELQYFTTKSPILAAGLVFLLNKFNQNVTFNVYRKLWDSGRLSHYIKGQIWSPRDKNLNGQHGKSGHNLRKNRFEVTKKYVDEIEGTYYDLETESGTFCAGAGLLHMNNSPRRGETFVTRKITRAATRIKLGLQNELVLGNLDSKRDWGYSPDYVDCMHIMLQHSEPGDYVVATGEMHSVREFVKAAFDVLGLDWKKHVKFNEAYLRPTEVDALCGDSSKARSVLGWEPTVDFKELVEIMVRSDLELARREKLIRDQGVNFEE